MIPGSPKRLSDVMNHTFIERLYLRMWWQRQLDPWWVRLVTLPAWIAFERRCELEIRRHAA